MKYCSSIAEAWMVVSCQRPAGVVALFPRRKDGNVRHCDCAVMRLALAPPVLCYRHDTACDVIASTGTKRCVKSVVFVGLLSQGQQCLTGDWVCHTSNEYLVTIAVPSVVNVCHRMRYDER